MVRVNKRAIGGLSTVRHAMGKLSEARSCTLSRSCEVATTSLPHADHVRGPCARPLGSRP